MLRLRHLLRAAAVAAAATSLAPAQTPVNIHSIMTNLPNSPYLNQNVTVTGVVVGLVNNANPAVYNTPGFFITNPNASQDTNAATAEGIQVATIAGTPCVANVGDLVTVTGTVLNVLVNGHAPTGANTPGTVISGNVCTVNGTGSVSNTSTLPTTANSFGQLLPFTGTPVNNNVFYAISPTSGTTDPTTGHVTSTGQFWAILKAPTNGGHLFKSAGLAADNFYPQTPPAPASGIPTWTANPQRLLIDTATFGGAPIDLGAGQVLTCTAGAGLTVGATAGLGVIDYSLGYSRLLLFKTTTCTVSGSIAPSITAPADSTHFHVGTINLSNFQGSASPVYATRVAKAALAIVNILGKPDILSVQEVQDLPTLQAIGDAASALAGSGLNYQAYIAPTTNDATNLSLGFLVNTNTVAVNKTYNVNATDTFTRFDGTTEPLFERPPFVLEAGLLRNGQNYQVEVTDIEITTRIGIDDPTNGINLWQRRGAQAQAIAVFANQEQLRGQNLLIAGEYNAYSFSDGFVDPIDIIANTGPPVSGTVAQYEPGVTSMTPMYNFVKSITVSNSTYNVIEQGNARSIEHILCSETQNTSASGSIYSYISTVTQPHWTTDYPAVDANDPTIPAGLTDRDGFVGAFLIPPVPTTASLTPTTANFGSVYVGANTSQTFTFTNTSTFPSTVTVQNIAFSGANAADFSQTSSCTSLNQNASCGITVTFAPGASGARSATLTVTSDSGAEPTLTATLTGTGVDTTATLTPATTNFPDTDIGATSPAQTFTYTNTTNGLPNPPSESILSTNISGDYAITANTCAGSIAAAATCTVSVVFQPTATGARPGTLTITDSSSANQTLMANFTGNGLNTTATLAPLTATFPSTDVTGTTPAQTFTVTNTSTIPVNLTGSNVSANFTQTASTCGGPLAPGASCTISVAFSPSTVGPLTGTLTVTDSTTGNPTLTATLTGTGLDTTATLSPLTSAFPDTLVATTSAPLTFTWTNTSTVPLLLKSTTTTGNFGIASTTCTGSIAAGATCTIAVTFTPASSGPHTGSVTVTSSSTLNPVLTATLTGTGVSDLELSALQVNFGNVDLGFPSPGMDVTLTNHSPTVVALSSFAITANYTFVTTCGATLSSQQSCQFHFVFTPTALGPQTGTFTFATDDASARQLAIGLTGNGVDFSITLSPTSGSTVAGINSDFYATITPLGGFNGHIYTNCTPPQGVTGAMSYCGADAQLTAPHVIHMWITTTSPYTLIGYEPAGAGVTRNVWMAALALLSLAGLFFSRKRRSFRMASLAALLLVCGLSNLACSGKYPDKNANPTQPGTYTYTVFVTDYQITHTTTFTQTVRWYY